MLLFARNSGVGLKHSLVKALVYHERGSLNTFNLCLPSIGIKGVCHHRLAQLVIFFEICTVQILRPNINVNL